MKKITFTAKSNYHTKVADKPYPAASAVPTWWKMSPSYIDNNGQPTKVFRVRNRQANTAFKKCGPMLEALTMGYIVPLWADVQVNTENEHPFINWRVKDQVFEQHGAQASEVPNPVGYHKTVFKYMNPWLITTPPGYSILAIEPPGYRNGVFKPIPGIVDTDATSLELLFPVWVRNDTDEVVESGTPIVQILPFKRDSWESEFLETTLDEYMTRQDAEFGKYLINNYMRRIRKNRSYR